MIVFGIDPGVSGAIAFQDGAFCGVFDMPIRPARGAGMIKREVDVIAMRKQMVGIVDERRYPAVLVVIEDVGIMGGKNNAVQTQGSLVRSFTVAQTLAELLGWPIKYARAQEWKKFYGLSTDKGASLETARRLYPQLSSELARAKDHNRAEALLITNYGVRKFS